jgi:hypothetical protein
MGTIISAVKLEVKKQEQNEEQINRVLSMI